MNINQQVNATKK